MPEYYCELCNSYVHYPNLRKLSVDHFKIQHDKICHPRKTCPLANKKSDPERSTLEPTAIVAANTATGTEAASPTKTSKGCC
jgi:hypothetical protein